MLTDDILFVFERTQRERAGPNQRKNRRARPLGAAHITSFLSDPSAEGVLLEDYQMKAGSVNEGGSYEEFMGEDATADKSIATVKTAADAPQPPLMSKACLR